jgi:hypothetical protein
MHIVISYLFLLSVVPKISKVSKGHVQILSDLISPRYDHKSFKMVIVIFIQIV